MQHGAPVKQALCYPGTPFPQTNDLILNIKANYLRYSDILYNELFSFFFFSYVAFKKYTTSIKTKPVSCNTHSPNIIFLNSKVNTPFLFNTIGDISVVKLQLKKNNKKIKIGN